MEELYTLAGTPVSFDVDGAGKVGGRRAMRHGPREAVTPDKTRASGKLTGPATAVSLAPWETPWQNVH
jgi:hypothetical protein